MSLPHTREQIVDNSQEMRSSNIFSALPRLTFITFVKTLYAQTFHSQFARSLYARVFSDLHFWNTWGFKRSTNYAPHHIALYSSSPISLRLSSFLNSSFIKFSHIP